MSQSMRMPPRQIGFKPSAPRLTQAQPASGAADARIRQQVLQLQQLQQRLRLQEDRLGQLKVPTARQALEAQNQQLKKQIQELQSGLLQARGEIRIRLLKPLIDEAGGLELLRPQLAQLEAIYRVQQPLPKTRQPLLDTWLQLLNTLVERYENKRSLPELIPISLGLESLGREIWQSEAEALKRWWERWLQELEALNLPAPEIAQAAPVAEASSAADDFELVSFGEQGTLELSFDLQNRRSVVRNQMGITLNQPKKSYQEYLEAGFAAIDQTVGNRFEDRQPLYQAVESFLEAISQDRSRYEAYFGLGYLYSLVKDLNHALYFLDLAWKISGDQTIKEMMERVRAACAPHTQSR